MPRLKKTTMQVENYLRVEFTNGNADVETVTLSRHMMTVYAEMALYGLRRVMIVVNTEPHENYSLDDLGRHAMLADTIFGDMKMAYVNPRAETDRERFIKAYSDMLHHAEIGIFSSEAEAAAWLTS